MDNQPSPITRAGDDTPPSPKRKKVRSKYAPKACVSCRRSKLKCSGENPCQRCLENGKRCFYSEDQTAAEALQNLSRPTPVQPPLATLGANGNNNTFARRSILPPHEVNERRASDASVLGLSMEARMARIEGMMETLIHERGASATPQGSMERDDAISDSLHSEFALQGLGDAFNPNFLQARQASFKLESPEQTRHPVAAISPSGGTDSPSTIRVGSGSFVFPAPSHYQKYIDFFFSDLNPCSPCINESDFRVRAEKMLATEAFQAGDILFLALNYIIFACSDIALDMSQKDVSRMPSGWQWYKAADELVGKKEYSQQGDSTLIQLLVLEAAYFMSADRPNAAYNIIGIACRLCFQFGLHQQSSWRDHTPFEIHMRQRIFWTAYVFDRRISLSCGRPYCIREADVDVEQPAYLYDKDVHPEQPLPDTDLARSSIMYLNSMICWGRLAADVWDGHCAAQSTGDESAFALNSRIEQWTGLVLPTIPLLPSDSQEHPLELRQLRQHTLVHTHLNQLRLFLFRQWLLTLKYDGDSGRVCGDLAIDIVQRIQRHTAEPKQPSSFRFHMVTALGTAVLTLSSLLVRDLSFLGLLDSWRAYAEAFREATRTLQDLSTHFATARRVLNDFKDIMPVVSAVLIEQYGSKKFPQHLVPANVRDLFPYTSPDFAQQPREGVDFVETGFATNSNAAQTNTDRPWDFDFYVGMSRYGVQWI